MCVPVSAVMVLWYGISVYRYIGISVSFAGTTKWTSLFTNEEVADVCQCVSAGACLSSKTSQHARESEISLACTKTAMQQALRRVGGPPIL